MTSIRDLYEQINFHILEDEKPSVFVNEVSEIYLFKQYPFNMLYNLKNTEQSLKYHPEGNAWNHTMLVLDIASQIKHKSSDKTAFMWGALLHDIGKPSTTKNYKGKIVSYDHDKQGAVLVKKFLSEFTNNLEFIDKVIALVRWHMQILFVVKNMRFAEIEKMKNQTDVYEIALLGYCDRMGRKEANKGVEMDNIKMFLKKTDFDNYNIFDIK